MNQGVLMEAYNLAATWRLPVVFVCRDNRWSITTRSRAVTARSPAARARALGLAVESARGRDVGSVYAAAGRLITRARAGKGPGFLHATCSRPGGHFEGDPIVGLLRHPAGRARELLGEVRTGLAAEGAATAARRTGVRTLAQRVALAAWDRALHARDDPVRRARKLLEGADAGAIDRDERDDMRRAMTAARAAVGDRVVIAPRVGWSR